MANTPAWRVWRRPNKPRQTTKPAEKINDARLTRKRDLLLAFAIVSLPLLVIALILLVFVFKYSQRNFLDPSVGTRELPSSNYDFGNVFYTSISPGSFLLVGSWASNVATIVVAPFMLLFSYAVAREMFLQQPSMNPDMSNARPRLLREIMGGAYGM